MARVGMTLAALLCLGLGTVCLVPAPAMAQQQASGAAGKADPAAPKPTRKAAAKKNADKDGEDAAEADGAGGAKKDGAKKDGGDHQKALAAAQRSLDADKADVAVGQIDALIAKGGLEPRNLARALAIRGQAYRRQGKPVQAIADLQSALYLRNGLSEADRARALEARAAAYREAGLGEAPGIGGGTPGRQAKSAAPATTTPVTTAAVPGRSAAAPAAEPQPPTASPPAPPATAGGSGSGGGIGGFFTNLFGGGNKAAPPPADPPRAVPTSPAVSSWSEPAKAEAKSKAPARVAAATVAPGAAAPPAAAPPATAPAAAAPADKADGKEGRIVLRLAAQRSEGEAKAVAERVKAEHAEVGRRTQIEEVVFGGMGTFYRPNLGPVADMATARRLCASIRSKGVDCEPVAR